jgi:putative endonuclease
MGISGIRGRAAEALAAAYLELAGFEILERNVKVGGVEIDLLAREKDVQVVVEVKYRSRSDFGGALGAIDPGKRDRLRRAASVLVARGRPDVRIDVVSVELSAEGVELRHVRGAVGA